MCDCAIKWWESCLSIGKNQVKFKNGMSDCVYIDHRIPQGTLLGPALFSLYNNDLKNSIEQCDVMLFCR